MAHPVDGSKERKSKEVKVAQASIFHLDYKVFHNHPANALTLSPGIMPLTETGVGGISQEGRKGGFQEGLPVKSAKNEFPVIQNHPLVK